MSHFEDFSEVVGDEEAGRNFSLEQGPPLSTFQKILEEIEILQQEDDSSIKRLKVVIGQLEASEEVQVAKEEADYVARLAALEKQAEGAQMKLQERIRRVLLSVVTAATLQGVPGKVETISTNADSVVATQNSTETRETASLSEKLRSPELIYQDIFDTQSSLNVASKKLNKESFSPEELVIVHELAKRARMSKEEWAIVSGKNTTGRFTFQLFQGTEDGVFFSLEAMKKMDVTRFDVAHTHPLSTEDLENHDHESGTRKRFLYPPSADDIRTCLVNKNPFKVHRVIDASGMWEYQCDKQNPFVVEATTSLQRLGEAFDQLSQEYKLITEERQRLLRIVETLYANSFAVVTLVQYFAALEERYPGIDAAGTRAINEHAERAKKLFVVLMRNDLSVEWIRRNMNKWTDSELATRLQFFVQEAEENGVFMSYTPFKEISKREEKK